MKKFIAAALLMLIVGTGAFAMDWAIGGGGMFNMAWTSGALEWDVIDNWGYGPEWIAMKDEWTLRRSGFGAFAFLGLGRLFEVNFGFLYKIPKRWTGTVTGTAYADGYEGINYDYDNAANSDASIVAMQFGLYFKYPFVLSDRFVLFPTVGVDYELTFGKEDNVVYGWNWWDDLWFRGGVGLDIFFTERVFMRTHFIYGAGIPIGGEGDEKITHGLLIKVGIGWMF